MPSLNELRPDRVLTTDQERLIAEQSRPGFYSLLGHGSNITFLGNLWRSYEGSRRRVFVDPDFRLDDKTFDELTLGLPEHLWEGFADTVSLEHARQLRRGAVPTCRAGRLLPRRQRVRRQRRVHDRPLRRQSVHARAARRLLPLRLGL